MSIPHLFRCPISLDIFTDPVTLRTGQTYDRQCIERWLADGHRTCPVTMQPLGDAALDDLVPNRTLRHLIDRWLSAATDHRLPLSAAGDDDEEPSLAALKRCLLLQPDAAKVISTLKKVLALASESDVGRACMLQLGFLRVLLPLVFHAPARAECRSDQAEVEELALRCALSLMPTNPVAPELDCLNVLKREPCLASFVRLLERGSASARAGLCRVLETVATADATRDDLALLVAASPRVWDALLMPLLSSDADPEHEAEAAAVRAVAAVVRASEPARGSAVSHGAVGALVRHLSKARKATEDGAAASALAAVESLAAGSEAGRRAVAGAPGATRTLVRHVFRMASSSSDACSENAVAALLAVCGESRAARSEAVGAGVVTQLLLLLQSQCGARAKAKARALLKLLKSK
ncbi:U-box domain-containing protein 26 [Brachypodium distachyon]|uniref:U-box domain-containing protein 26 n=1 Tax=Brachypodium distachyon TaxID=15368 RepID=UPI0001C6FF5C|nr:U-box domain-containing protein 26 [Brachypodium distachyon]|eukprot:XP_003581250.1 U-box domain-containing protein 26 [Brachypodium distachyon]